MSKASINDSSSFNGKFNSISSPAPSEVSGSSFGSKSQSFENNGIALNSQNISETDRTISQPSTISLAREDKLNINTKSYDWKKYTDKILREKNIPGLLIQANTLDSEIRKLDSDMKSLVYENYSKFIKATDTLNEMRSCAENMEKQMELLSNKFGKISKDGKEIDISISSGRAEIQALNSKLKLENKMKSFNELPEKLLFSVINGNYIMSFELWAQIFQTINSADRLNDNPDPSNFKNDLESTINDILQILWPRWKDTSLPISEATSILKLLFQISQNDTKILMEQYLEIQSKRLEIFLDQCPKSSSKYETISSFNAGFLSNWNGFISGFLVNFISPEYAQNFENSSAPLPQYLDNGTISSEAEISLNYIRLNSFLPEIKFLTEENLEISNISSESQTLKDVFVFGWQSMSQSDIPHAQKIFYDSSEKIIAKFEAKYIDFLEETWNDDISQETSLDQLDKFIVSAKGFPLLLKYGGLKQCVGRIIRLSHEQLIAKIFHNIIFDLFTNVSGYFLESEFIISDSTQNLFHGNISRLDALLVSTFSKTDIYDFLIGEQNKIIFKIKKNLVPLIQKAFNHYSNSENTILKDISFERYLNSATTSSIGAELKKIFISMLNSQLDKFHREYLPSAIAYSLGVDTDLEKRRIESNSNGLKVFERIVKDITRIENPAALTFFSRFCLDLDQFLIKSIYVVCEKAVLFEFISPNPNFTGVQLLPKMENEQLDKDEENNYTNDKVEELIKESFEFEDFRSLQFNEDSLNLLMNRISELLVLSFIKTLGNDLTHLSNIMVSHTLESKNSVDISAKTDIFSDWINKNPNTVDNLESLISSSEINGEMVYSKNSKIAHYNMRISMSALILRRWFEVLEKNILSLFTDNFLFITVQKHKSEYANIFSSNNSQLHDSKTNQYDVSDNGSIKSSSAVAKKYSLNINSYDLSKSSKRGTGDINDLSHITHSSNILGNRMSSNIMSSDSLLLLKINKLFADKPEFYPVQVTEFSASNILYLLSIVYLKGCVEFWRGGFFFSCYGRNNLSTVVVLNREQLNQLRLDLEFQKLYLSDYSSSVFAQTQSSSGRQNNSKRTGTGNLHKSLVSSNFSANIKESISKYSKPRVFEPSRSIRSTGLKSLKSPHLASLSKTQSGQQIDLQRRFSAFANTGSPRNSSSYASSPILAKSPLAGYSDNQNPSYSGSAEAGGHFGSPRTKSVSNSKATNKNFQPSTSFKASMHNSNINKTFSPKIDQTQSLASKSSRLNSIPQNFESHSPIGGYVLGRGIGSGSNHSPHISSSDSGFRNEENPQLTLINDLGVSICNRYWDEGESDADKSDNYEEVANLHGYIELISIRTYLELV
ncbi:Vacuolar protein sorting-associated protein 51-like protein [Smittium culicis]|uniref:Vacuolar protein sorting-associated protein 51-like protein n=1 Tax=Smittium culicis TaxID=133412 RepID=A0A1R1XY11_9FUNG|nr:Vacuolar protein sorting-associated protein 51-like protein [Smittium culicis]